jgi:hypothetical protein
MTYGRSEALLERKWPEKYNSAGHVTWAGRLYAPGLTRPLRRRGRVWHGLWGTGLFQSVYEPAAGTLAALPLMPEWFLLLAGLAGLSALGAVWGPLLLFLPLLLLALGAAVAQSILSAAKASFTSRPASRLQLIRWRGLVALLHLAQPAARLSGRLELGLTPWRHRPQHGLALPRCRRLAVWSESWHAPEERLRALERSLRAMGAKVVSGGPFDRWDLEVRAGAMCAVRIRTAVEEHGRGRQLARFRCSPRWSAKGAVAILVFAGLALGAALAEAIPVAGLLAVVTLALVVRVLVEGAGAMATAVTAIEAQRQSEADTGRSSEPSPAPEPRPAATIARG